MQLDESLPTSMNIGSLLAGKYRIERVLGAGGMGVVVAAMHEELGHRVAIKFLRPSACESADVVNRFEQEARAASRLRSQHVARVTDIARLDNGSPYMVMEYLEGYDLAQVLETEGPLPVARACSYLLQAIEAVAEAHAARIVHRDLKPANLFLTKHINGDPLVKVLDFGVSKALEGTDLALTRSQALVGSPLYMSPEQMRSSKDIDARADVWSLGVILYELLTGRYPFEAESMPALVFKVTLEDPARPRLYRPDIPAKVESIILRCLAKAPNNRVANVADLAWELEPFADDSARGSAKAIAAVLRLAESRPSHAQPDAEASGAHERATQLPHALEASLGLDSLSATADAESDPRGSGASAAGSADAESPPQASSIKKASILELLATAAMAQPRPRATPQPESLPAISTEAANVPSAPAPEPAAATEFADPSERRSSGIRAWGTTQTGAALRKPRSAMRLKVAAAIAIGCAALAAAFSALRTPASTAAASRPPDVNMQFGTAHTMGTTVAIALPTARALIEASSPQSTAPALPPSATKPGAEIPPTLQSTRKPGSAAPTISSAAAAATSANPLSTGAHAAPATTATTQVPSAPSTPPSSSKPPTPTTTGFVPYGD